MAVRPVTVAIGPFVPPLDVRTERSTNGLCDASVRKVHGRMKRRRENVLIRVPRKEESSPGGAEEARIQPGTLQEARISPRRPACPYPCTFELSRGGPRRNPRETHVLRKKRSEGYMPKEN